MNLKKIKESLINENLNKPIKCYQGNILDVKISKLISESKYINIIYSPSHSEILMDVLYSDRITVRWLIDNICPKLKNEHHELYEVDGNGLLRNIVKDLIVMEDCVILIFNKL